MQPFASPCEVKFFRGERQTLDHQPFIYFSIFFQVVRLLMIAWTWLAGTVHVTADTALMAGADALDSNVIAELLNTHVVFLK